MADNKKKKILLKTRNMKKKPINIMPVKFRF